MRNSDTNADMKKDAVGKVEKALEKGFAAVESPSDASDVLKEVEAVAGDTEEQDIPPEAGSSDPVKQAEAIKAAADSVTPKDRPAAVLANTALQIASAPPGKREALDEAVEKASSSPVTEESQQVRRGRSLLRDALLRRLKPFDATILGTF